MGMSLQDKAEDSAFPARSPAWRRHPDILLPLAFVAAHASAIALGGGKAWLLSLLFLVFAPLLAAAACFHRARRDAFLEGWIALGAAMLLWAGGMASNLLAGLWLDSWSGAAGFTLLLFILYGVPIIFVLAAPDRESWPVRLIDAALAAILGYLFFRHTFAFATLADTSTANLLALRLMFDIENLFIALFAAIRFLASADPVRRACFRSLTLFAFAYLATAAFINHLYADVYYGSPSDLVIGLPFTLLAGLAIAHHMPGKGVLRTSPAFPHVVQAAAPLMLPATLLMVSASLVRIDPALAIAGCGAAILGYGLRTILVQLRSLDAQSRLERLSRIDALTGLANRREFDESLRREWDRAARSGNGMALLMIDVDQFKLLNDGLGHPVGDQRLRAVAEALAGCATRGSDLVARYGGEEFAVILPAANLAEAMVLAETIRCAVERLDLPSPAPGGRVTVSIGIGHVDRAEGGNAALLIADADAALYRAKRDGRNRSIASAKNSMAD